MNRPALDLHDCHQPRFLRAIHQNSRAIRRILSPRLGQLVLGILPVILATKPAFAADHIYFSYGAFERSVSIQSLETYAKTGSIEGDLTAYTRYATPDQLEQLREILLTRADINPVAVSQFLYTAQGEVLLEQLGNLIQTEAHLSGFYAIRAALILAAADPEGLTLINVLQKFPTQGVRIEVDRTLSLVSQLERLINQSNLATAAVQAEAAIEITASPVNFSLPDLRQPGPNRFQRQTIRLVDIIRNRTFLADVYLPIAPSRAAPLPPAPVIIISHGLGSDRTSYGYLAAHLASYGFVVALPEHPGSNADQLAALLEGRASEVAEPIEFVDRPLDIKFLLDELERRSRNNALFQGRLNLQQVGVVGQSFGGYTALALAGAKINRDQIRANCLPGDTFNLSFLLQCRARELTSHIPNLRDDRVKAIIAINPINSTVMGQESLSQIKIPTMIVGGNADTVAPALPEQIRPFTWLTTLNRYLVLIRGATHFSTIGDSTRSDGDVVDFPPEVIGPDPTVARRYMTTLSVAFFRTYLANQPDYEQYLRSSYASSISQPLLPLTLIRSLTPDQLMESLEGQPPQTARNNGREKTSKRSSENRE
jgi:predicted dienelactone hydrolase